MLRQVNLQCGSNVSWQFWLNPWNLILKSRNASDSNFKMRVLTKYWEQRILTYSWLKRILRKQFISHRKKKIAIHMPCIAIQINQQSVQLHKHYFATFSLIKNKVLWIENREVSDCQLHFVHVKIHIYIYYFFTTYLSSLSKHFTRTGRMPELQVKKNNLFIVSSSSLSLSD